MGQLRSLVTTRTVAHVAANLSHRRIDIFSPQTIVILADDECFNGDLVTVWQ